MLPSMIESIPNGAFLNCLFVSDLNIPENVTTIGNYAFADYEFGGSLVTSPNLERIGDFSFSRCSFKEVILFEGIISVSLSAFDAPSKL